MGVLHSIDKCAHVYITDLDGIVREYKVVLIDTIEQAQTESDRQVWGIRVALLRFLSWLVLMSGLATDLFGCFYWGFL